MQLELNIGKKDEEMATFLTNNQQLTKLGKNGIKTLQKIVQIKLSDDR